MEVISSFFRGIGEKVKNILENVLFNAIDVVPIGEVKEFPIQFDKDGNLLIKNLKKIYQDLKYGLNAKERKVYLVYTYFQIMLSNICFKIGRITLAIRKKPKSFGCLMY